MRKLLNTLYVLSPESYLALENENVVIRQEGRAIERYPLIMLEAILSFSSRGASVPLMTACAKRGIQLSFLSSHGRFLCRVCDAERGNVMLRREQYRIADKPEQALAFARETIAGKLHNSSIVLKRAMRETDHPEYRAALQAAFTVLDASMENVHIACSVDQLMGIEGAASKAYFHVFDRMIQQQKESFRFVNRSARPPKDRVNAMLSYGYTLLANDCTAALEAVGLDACVGFLHQDHVGRPSLALDLMEEFRALMVDRLVLRLINLHEIRAEHFDVKEDATLLNHEGRKRFLQAWQQKKQEIITHPTLDEKLEWGLVPYAQAQLLARSIREQSCTYNAFTWR